MRKVFFVLAFFIQIQVAFAVNSVGVASLILPQDNDYIVNYNSGIALDQIKQINKNITSLTIKALNKFNIDLLKTKSLESSIVLFNATDSIHDIIKNKAKFLNDIATEDIVPTNESMVTMIKSGNNKIYLIGHVVKISCGEMRHKIMTSSNISWLYNLDVVIKFRVVDAITLKPIAEFTGIGHGGVAKILNNPKQIIEINPDKMINETMSALNSNVWHSLLVLNQKVD